MWRQFSRTGKSWHLSRKETIPNYGEFYEARHFVAGNAEAENFMFDGEEIRVLAGIYPFLCGCSGRAARLPVKSVRMCGRRNHLPPPMRWPERP